MNVISNIQVDVKGQEVGKGLGSDQPEQRDGGGAGGVASGPTAEPYEGEGEIFVPNPLYIP